MKWFVLNLVFVLFTLHAATSIESEESTFQTLVSWLSERGSASEGVSSFKMVDDHGVRGLQFTDSVVDGHHTSA